MIGLLLNQTEVKEVEYLIKRELDEIIFDLNDERIDKSVKKAMMERYQELFSLLKRVAPPKVCLQYIIRNKKYLDKKMK
ncbi:MAG: hypothetical protein ABF649_01255 [Bacillus sp. (in: firmicutes)]